MVAFSRPIELCSYTRLLEWYSLHWDSCGATPPLRRLAHSENRLLVFGPLTVGTTRLMLLGDNFSPVCFLSLTVEMCLDAEVS